jgi:hypothetical protein
MLLTVAQIIISDNHRVTFDRQQADRTYSDADNASPAAAFLGSNPAKPIRRFYLKQ